MNVANPYGLTPVRVTRALVDRAAFFSLLGSAVRLAEPDSAPVLILIELGGMQDVSLANGPAMALAEAAAGRIAGVVGEGGYVSVQRNGRIAVLAEYDGSAAIEGLTAAFLASLVRPLAVEGLTLLAGATLGTAYWDRDGETAEELFVAADHAIRSAPGDIPQQPAATFASVNFLPSPLRAA